MSMSETEWQRRVTDLCDWLGLRWFHSGDSRRDSCAGWPDLVIVGNRVLYAELKVGRNHLTREQAEWINALRNAGQEAVVWWPQQWDSVEAKLRALSPRRMLAVPS